MRQEAGPTARSAPRFPGRGGCSVDRHHEDPVPDRVDPAAARALEAGTTLDGTTEEQTRLDDLWNNSFDLEEPAAQFREI